MNNPEILAAMYRKNLHLFAEKAMAILEPGTKLKTSWHHRAICYQLELCFQGLTRHLVINQPPKTLKSHLVSVAFVAWLLMHNPGLKIAILCYDEDLASKMLRMVRQIMGSPWFKSLAPNTHIKGDKNTEFVFETTVGGECQAKSVNGGVTGHGFDFILGDDLMKATKASSEPERRSLEETYAAAIANRWRDPGKGVFILVMQRLHIDDFTNYFLKTHKNAIHLNIPAIAPCDLMYDLGPDEKHVFKKGELLEPDRLTREHLDLMRTLQGSAHFDAQYLQDPQASGGTIIKPEWLRTYTELRKPDYKIISIDPAFTQDGGDYTAAVVANLIGEEIEIIHAVKGQFDSPRMLQWINNLDQRYKPDLLVIETIGAGQLIPHYLFKHDSINHIFKIDTHRGKDKIERMEMISPLIEKGHLLLPQRAEWLDPFKDSLTHFPYADFNDWPDCVSQLFLYLSEIRTAAMVCRERRSPKEIKLGHGLYYQKIEFY